MDTKNIFNKIISLFLKVRLFILSEHNGLLVFQMPSCIFLEDLKKVPSLCLCWDVVQLSLNPYIIKNHEREKCASSSDNKPSYYVNISMLINPVQLKNMCLFFSL